MHQLRVLHASSGSVKNIQDIIENEEETALPDLTPCSQARNRISHSCFDSLELIPMPLPKQWA